MSLLVLSLLFAAAPELRPTGGLFVAPADVPWLVEVRPDALALDPPPSVDHSDKLPPVGSQGSLPSCTSWAIGYYYKTYQEWQERNWDVNDPAHQFSPTFLYNMANAGGNVGSYYTDNMRLLCDFGCATFADCPNSSNPVPWPSESAFARALPYRCAEACYISCGSDPGIVAVKQHIADGDLAVLPINVWSNFDNINNFDTCYCSVDRYGSNRGGHYVTFVGYDDNRATNDGPGAFRIVNSWGTGWGNRGFAWMSYQAVKDAQLSYRVGLFLRDRIGYSPRLVARALVSHNSREDVRIDAGLRRDDGTLWSKTFFNRDLDRRGSHPVPGYPIPLDLTDGADSLDPTDTSSVFVECRDVANDGITGVLASVSAVDVERGAFGRASSPGVQIPDDGAAAGLGFALPGQRLHWPGFHRFPAHLGASELRADLDTLRFAGDVLTGGAVSAGPALGDLDADGRQEIVFGSDDGVLRVVNGGDGSLLWSDSVEAAVVAAPAIGDFDSDGRLDVAVGVSDGTVWAWDGESGVPLWTDGLGAAVSGGVTVGDVDMDGRLELIVGTAAGAIAALNGEDGSVLWTVMLPAAVSGAPALGDVDGDGFQEVVIGVTDSCWRPLNARTGARKPAAGLAGAAASSPALADLNGDGRLEVVVGTIDGMIHAFDGATGQVDWSFATGGSVSAAPAIGDVDGDGAPDIVFGSKDSTVYALGPGGLPLWTARVDGSVNSAPALGFLNGDDALDVLVGADDGRLYLISGADGALLAARATGGAVRSAPALGDIDGDGRLDVAVGSDDGRLYLFGGAPAGIADRHGPAPTGTGPTLEVAPVPAAAGSVVRVRFNAGDGAALRLYDCGGRLVRTIWSGPAGGRGLDLPVAGLAPGTYFMRLTGTATAAARLVLVR